MSAAVAGKHRGPFRLTSLLPDRGNLGFALYTSLASLLALWLAMWLQLDAPYWAASTVLITAQVTRAQSLLKGVNRLVGTVVGMVMGVVLIGLAPQSWEGFLFGHTLWLTLCTFVSCLVRSQLTYAVALSGYTALIVAVDSFGMPQNAFDTAVSRGSSVFLGVALFVMATRLFSPRTDIPVTRQAMKALVEDGRVLAVRLLRGEADAAAVARFLPEVGKVDEQLENAVTAARWLAPRRAVLRGAVLAVVDVLMEALLIRHRDPEGAQALAAALAAPASTGPDRSFQADDAAAALLNRAAVATSGLAALTRTGVPRRVQPVGRSHDRNLSAAALGACRAFLGMGSACVIWVVTRWPSGADFVLVVGILCCLFATRPSPVVGTRRFVIATVGTAVLALWVGFFVLPEVSGFGALALVLFPFLFVGALGVKSVRFGAYVTPMNFFLMSMADIRNTMTYDPLSFFNSVEALVLGSAYASLWFVLMPPRSTAAETARLRRLVEAGREHLAPCRRRLLQVQRLAVLLPRLKPAEASGLVARVAGRWPFAGG